MKWFVRFFNLSEHERRGYVVLLLVIAVIVLAPVIYRALEEHEPPDIATLQVLQTMQDADVGQSEEEAPSFQEDNAAVMERNSTTPLFYFNPNKLSAAQWRQLGFSDRQIQVIHNYERRGGVFTKPTDLAKIYSISEKDFQRIAPYLLFDKVPIGPIVPPVPPVASSGPPAEGSKNTYTPLWNKKDKHTTPIDINASDTVAFKQLKGIGSVFAGRIVKYRESLGGFYALEQLKEVYGLSDTLFVAISPFLSLERPLSLRKISINTVSLIELMKHPYCSKKQAQLILAYRNQHGPFENITDLNNIYALNADFLRKIEPYLSFN